MTQQAQNLSTKPAIASLVLDNVYTDPATGTELLDVPVVIEYTIRVRQEVVLTVEADQASYEQLHHAAQDHVFTYLPEMALSDMDLLTDSDSIRVSVDKN